MGIYVYKCPKCETTQEQMHAMNEKPSIKCRLGCKDVFCDKIVVGPRQFNLKGDGFEKPGKNSHGYPQGGNKPGKY